MFNSRLRPVAQANDVRCAVTASSRRLTAGEDKPLCMHDSNAMVEVEANDLQISFQHVCQSVLSYFDSMETNMKPNKCLLLK